MFKGNTLLNRFSDLSSIMQLKEISKDIYDVNAWLDDTINYWKNKFKTEFYFLGQIV